MENKKKNTNITLYKPQVLTVLYNTNFGYIYCIIWNIIYYMRGPLYEHSWSVQEVILIQASSIGRRGDFFPEAYIFLTLHIENWIIIEFFSHAIGTYIKMELKMTNFTIGKFVI